MNARRAIEDWLAQGPTVDEVLNRLHEARRRRDDANLACALLAGHIRHVLGQEDGDEPEELWESRF